MKVLLSAVFLVLTCLGARAQQNYFVYIQTDNKQPFFVKMNEKIMSSSASGYIVIPKLTTGSYTLNIGFPKDEFPQLTVPLIIGNADAGYLLKNFGEKGWGLYNIQTMQLTMNGSSAPQNSGAGGDDIFANVLAGAANTKAPVQPVPPTQPVTPPPENKPEPSPPAKVVAAHISKISVVNAPEGMSMLYEDRSEASRDTVRVFIPVKIAPPLQKQPTEVVNTATTTVQVPEPVVKQEPAPIKDRKFLDIELKNPNRVIEDGSKAVAGDDSTVKVTAPAKVPSESAAKTTDKPVVAFNSDCRQNAVDEDFLKIRKRMAAANSDEAMVAAAKKFFRAKCYSTEQIKNLSLLFLTDAGKYNFFDAAYPHTFDTQNFPSLASQLREEYFINRFKAMVRN